jgi:ATP-dependent RNA helicase RhlE
MALQETSRATFSDLGASHAVVRALESRGVVEPFPVQTLVLPDALEGRDVLAKSRTGSGKTIAFAVPIVERLEPSGPRPSAVILTPTRELALQVTEELTALARARKLRVAPVYGGVDLRSQARIAERAHILVATPGRLEDLADRRLLDLSKVSIFILDEADRMLDMGFLPQVNQIVRRLPKKRQTMFFSATLDGEAGRLARAYTTDAVRHEVVGKAQTVDEVAHRFIPVTTDTKVAVLAAELMAERGLALVFVRTKRGADRLVRKLKAQGVSALALHGDMTQAARTRAVERFGRGDADTLIATDVAARGLDLSSITHVFNFDPPEDDKSYVHRVGRTARAGRSGTGITFVLPDQRYEVGRLASRLKLGAQFQEEGMAITPPRVLYASRKGRRSRGLGRR